MVPKVSQTQYTEDQRKKWGFPGYWGASERQARICLGCLLFHLGLCDSVRALSSSDCCFDEADRQASPKNYVFDGGDGNRNPQNSVDSMIITLAVAGQSHDFKGPLWTLGLGLCNGACTKPIRADDVF